MPRRGVGLGVTRCRGGGDAPDPGPAYLLRDEFTTGLAAPLPSPRTCEPGPGTLTLVQADGQFSVSGGKLTAAANATGGFNRLYWTAAPAVARQAGRAVLYRQVIDAAGGSGPMLGLWARSPVFTAGDFDAANAAAVLWHRGPADTRYYDGGAAVTGLDAPPAADTDYAVVLRSAGSFALARPSGEWKLVWVGVAAVPATLHAAWTSFQRAATLDSLRAADLGAPWDTDHGIAGQRLAGAVLAGTDFAHTADALVEWTQTLLPGVTSANTAVSFRRQDADNRWSAEVTPSGSLVLNEVVGGGVTQRAIASGIVAAGHRVVVVFDGAVVRGYSNNALRWTYSSANNFQSATAGRLESLGTGGAVSDIVAWPRSVEGLMPSV